MRKRITIDAHVFLYLIVAIVAAFSVWTMPAHGAPLPAPPKEEQPKPEGEVTITIYKVLPLQPGDTILIPKRWSPEDPIPEDPTEAAKDPRTWA